MAEAPTIARRLPNWTMAAAIGAVSLLASASLGLQPQDPREAAGVFPLWWSQGRTVSAAARAGDIVAVGAAPFIVIARSNTPDVAAALRAEGAWLIIDPGLAALCGAKDS